MATEVLWANASTGNMAGVADTYGANDGVYAPADGVTDAWTQQWTFPTPSGTIEGTQNIWLWMDKGAAGGTDPMGVINLLNGGVFVRQLSTGNTIPGPTEGGFDIDAAEVPNGMGIEIVAERSGGKPSERRVLTVDAIRWTANLYEFLGSEFMAYDGGAWVPGKLKRWDGGQWAPAQVQRWTGAAWENVP